MPDPTDSSLIIRTLAGETNAFGELVHRYQRVVFNVCYRLVGERRAAEDFAQEAFVRAFQRLGTFDPQREFAPWIRRVTTNVCYSALQNRRLNEIPLDDESDQSEWQRVQNTEQPEELLLQAERNAVIRTALLELAPHYRVVLELRHFQELSYAEMAIELNLPLNTVRSHLFRARKLLAQRLSVERNVR